MKRIIRYLPLLLLFYCLIACTAWDDDWQEIHPLPEADTTIDVDPWEEVEKEDEIGH